MTDGGGPLKGAGKNVGTHENNGEDAAESQKNAVIFLNDGQARPRAMRHSDDEVAAVPC